MTAQAGAARSYVVCTVKPWNVAAFHRRTPALPGAWHLLETANDLTIGALERLSPRYVFFPHWSWRVPPEIVGRFECVCFHMADVPYGRGGSPLQNLVVRGHKSTQLTALRMVDELDAGPVYLKHPLSLAGRAEEIFERAADLTYDLISDIVATEPTPVAQSGAPVVFPRRTPQQSVLPQAGSAEELHDFIRMLDAPTYPKAFLDWGDLRLEFDHSRLDAADAVEARVVIRKKDGS
jgi:methionyl-tRNA formyltransferase